MQWTVDHLRLRIKNKAPLLGQCPTHTNNVGWTLAQPDSSFHEIYDKFKNRLIVTPKNIQLLFTTFIMLGISTHATAQSPIASELFPKISASSAQTWGGFYGGLNAGYAFPGSQNVNINSAVVQYCPAGGCTDNPAAAYAAAAGANGTFSLFNDGFIGGGQLGYSRTLQHQFVTGLEVDIQGIAGATRSGPTLIHVNNSNTGAHPVSVESDLIASKTIDYLGTLRGRLGFLATPTMLLSATGGLAYGGVSSRTIIAQSYLLSPGNVQNNWGSTGSYADTRVGWTAGGNLEWMFRPNWSTKIEYLYYDLGTATYNSNNLIAANIGAQVKNFLNNSVSTTTQFNGQLVRIGANYHFS